MTNDNTSIFSVVDDVNVSVVKLNDLFKISKWEYQWKMSFNPGVSKQVLEVALSPKSHKLVLSHKPSSCSLQ